MSATYGLRSSTSSASAALQQSLASKLPELLATHGGTMWQQTWRARHTPLRRLISAHTASARSISDSGSTGWPTPNAGPQNDGDTTWQARREALKAKHGNGNGFGMNLGQAATLATWPTPQSRDGAHSRSGMPERTGGQRKNLDDYVTLAAWATPTRSDHQGAASPEAVKDWASRGHNLPEQAQMAGWQTPQSRDHKGANLPGNELTHNARPLNEQARLILGPTSNGSSAATAKLGQLNGAFSLWLMGYPEVEWLLAAPSPQPRARKPAPMCSTEPAC